MCIDYCDSYKVTWYDKSAHDGNRVAQYKLAQRYEIGFPMDRDILQSFKWYKLSAEQGYANAQVALALMYFCGEVVDFNKDEAVCWLKKAAVQGQETALFFLENLGNFNGKL